MGPGAAKGIAPLADKYKAPVLIHLAETADESRTSQKQHKMSPTRYLESLGFWGARTLAALNRVEEALEFMGLSEASRRLVLTYSGGMVRRLEIAQTLIHRPRVLFLDEPTIGLDPVARRVVWGHLDDLRTRYGTTLFVTTHYMEEAQQLCTRVAIMNHGRVVALGTPGELVAQLGLPEADLEDAFAHFTGGSLESGGNYRDVRNTRRTAGRLR